MKIRIESGSITTPNITGVGHYTKLLAEALAQEKNTSVQLFAFNFFNRKTQQPISGSIKTEMNYLFPLKVYAKLHSYKVAPAFDVNLTPVDLTIFPNFARWPSIKTNISATVIHDLTYIHFPDLMEAKNLAHLRRVVKQSILQSDFIITVSETIKKEIVDYFSIPSNKVIVTPIPPSVEFYKKNNNEVHKKYKITTDKYILSIGTIEPRKQIPLLIKSYGKLPKDIRNTYSLVISGGMGWKSGDSTEAIIDARKQGFNVVYTGYVANEDRTALYQKSSLVVMPSTYEGFGMPLLEAAASNIPIVASDIPVFREVAGDGALYFTPLDGFELTQKIALLLKDTSLQRELIKNASKHLSSFSWKKNAQLVIAKTKELEKK